MKPETPRKLSAAAAGYYGWLWNKLEQAAAEDWQPVDGTLLAAAAELLEAQELLRDALAEDSTNATLLRLRLQYAAQVASYSKLLGLCPKHRERKTGLTAEAIDRIAEELGVSLEDLPQ